MTEQGQEEDEPTTENVGVGAQEDVDEGGDATSDHLQPHQQVCALVLYLDWVHCFGCCLLFFTGG